jgi:DNA-binding SARP family transcriptional activator
LRRTLEPGLPARHPSSFITRRAGWCVLTLRPGYLDVTDFSATVRKAGDFSRQGDRERSAECYRRAIALYNGDFLEDEPYAAWAEIRRERLRNLCATALIHLAAYDLDKGDTDEAADLGLRALAMEPASEPAYRVAMTAYARSGQWGRVVALYRRYRDAMAEYEFTSPLSLPDLLAESAAPRGVSAASHGSVARAPSAVPATVPDASPRAPIEPRGQ